MSQKKQVLVDVEKALMAKTKGKKPSKLVVFFLKKIAHQNDINYFLTSHPTEQGLDFLEEGLKYLQVKLEVEGIDNVPKNKRYVFVSNHPLGGLDGMALGHFLGRQFGGKIKFLSNDILMNLQALHCLFIPINKHGSQGKKSAEIFNETFESDEQLLIYPAGMCSRMQNRRVYDLEWKKSFVTKAVQYKRDIVPIYFDARNSRFFYTLANIRRFLKIKLNIEMLFLVDEMFKQRNKTFKAYIGKPIPWESLDNSKTSNQWAIEIKKTVYKLSKAKD